MKVTVKFPSYMRALTKTDQAIIILSENAIMSDLLEVLTERYGGRFIDFLHTSELGDTPIWASVRIDEQDVLVDGLATSNLKLKEGAVIVLLGPVGGG